MRDKTAPALTWPQLVGQLEQLGRRLGTDLLVDLMAYLRHEALAALEPVDVETKMLVGYYELPPALKTWLQTCSQACEEWVGQCRRDSDDCIARTADQARQCQCFFAKLDPLFASSAALLAAKPAQGALEEELQSVLDIVLKALNRLTVLSSASRRGDWTWVIESLATHEERLKKK